MFLFRQELKISTWCYFIFSQWYNVVKQNLKFKIKKTYFEQLIQIIFS